MTVSASDVVNVLRQHGAIQVRVGGFGLRGVAGAPADVFKRATNTDSGDANAITATTSTSLNGYEIIALPIIDANTSTTVTVTFNGGSALTIKVASGNGPAVGGLASGMTVYGIVNGSNFELISDEASAAIDVAANVHAATGKTTPADNDEFGLADSAASYGLKKFTWANLKAAISSWLDATYIPGLFTGATELVAPAVDDYVLLRKSDGSIRKIPAFHLLGGNMIDTTFEFGGSASTTAARIVEEAENYLGLKDVLSFEIFNADPSSKIAVAFGGSVPVVDGAGSITVGPGALYSTDKIPKGEIRLIGESAAPYTCRFSTISGINPNALAAYEAHLARYSSAPSSAWQDAIKALYFDLYNYGLLDVCQGLFILAAPAEQAALLNWATTGGSGTSANSPTFAATGVTFDGATQYINSGLTLSNGTDVSRTSVFMAAHVDTTIGGVGETAVGMGVTGVEANRTASTFALNGVSTSGDVVTISGLGGGLQGLVRQAQSTFVGFHNDDYEETFTREARSDWGTVEGTVVMGAGRNPSDGSVNEYFSGKLQAAAWGAGKITETQRDVLYNALATYVAAAGAI